MSLRLNLLKLKIIQGGIMEFFIANKALVFGVLLAVSELLSVLPQFKANGIFQLVYNFIKQLVSPAPKA
jgi:hypothetical protein